MEPMKLTASCIVLFVKNKSNSEKLCWWMSVEAGLGEEVKLQALGGGWLWNQRCGVPLAWSVKLLM